MLHMFELYWSSSLKRKSKHYVCPFLSQKPFWNMNIWMNDVLVHSILNVFLGQCCWVYVVRANTLLMPHSKKMNRLNVTAENRDSSDWVTFFPNHLLSNFSPAFQERCLTWSSVAVVHHLQSFNLLCIQRCNSFVILSDCCLSIILTSLHILL